MVGQRLNDVYIQEIQDIIKVCIPTKALHAIHIICTMLSDNPNTTGSMSTEMLTASEGEFTYEVMYIIGTKFGRKAPQEVKFIKPYRGKGINQK